MYFIYIYLKVSSEGVAVGDHLTVCQAWGPEMRLTFAVRQGKAVRMRLVIVPTHRAAWVCHLVRSWMSWEWWSVSGNFQVAGLLNMSCQVMRTSEPKRLKVGNKNNEHNFCHVFLSFFPIYLKGWISSISLFVSQMLTRAGIGLGGARSPEFNHGLLQSVTCCLSGCPLAGMDLKRSPTWTRHCAVEHHKVPSACPWPSV